MLHTGFGHGDVRVILAALGSSAAAKELARAAAAPETPPPFVTISCEPGMKGMTLAQAVVRRLSGGERATGGR